MFVATMLVTVFGYILVAAPTTYAADAEWNGSAITYQDHQFTQIADAATGDSHNLPAGSKVYSYIEPTPAGTSGTQKAELIYFPPSTDLTTATSAQYVTYDFTPPNTYANPTAAKAISTTPQPAGASAGTTSCDSSATHGIGWIICPVTNFLAGAMDWLFDILSSFLTVRPVQTNQDNALYRAWSFMRNFANIAFVIGFLIIIYSQISTIGLSNYGIKKLLPRLIIAAVLVNVSYWICAIAIDVSNILGYSVQNIFIAMRNGLVGTEGNSWQVWSWQSIGSFILSGGTAATVGVVGATTALVATGGSIAAALYLLLPILAGVLIAVLVALLVLAARQALITILVILAPLAFVAYLLPNTEKYFDKWRDTFMTMLLLFPIFSVIFGGSQLAGVAIIQNANSINMLLLGMAVQVAPVVVTPLLVKFSGSLLGRIAGMVNNPNRGILDRTRKFSEERANQHQARALAMPGGSPLKRRAAQRDHRRRQREGWQKANVAAADATWANTNDAHDIHFAAEQANLRKEVGETTAQQHFEAAKLASSDIQELDINARAAKLRVDLSKAQVDANWDEIRAGDVRSTATPAGLSVAALANYMHERNNLAQSLQEDTIEARVQSQRQRSAQHVQTQQFANALNTDISLRQVAGGIDASGATKAHAAAVSELSKAESEELDAGMKLLTMQALRSGTTVKSLSGQIVRDVTAGIGTYSTPEVEAALEAQAQDGQIVNLERARMSASVDQDVLSKVIARNAGKLKEKGGFHLQNDPGLALQPITVMHSARATSLGDTSASMLKDLKKGWVEEVSNNINDIIANGNPQDLSKAYNNVYEALTNDQIRATVGDRIEELQNIELALRNQGYRAAPTTI